MFLTTSPYVLIDSDMFYGAIFKGLGMALKMTWPYLLIIIALLVVKEIVSGKIDRRNAQLRKEREDEEFERKVERFLEKKEEHERINRR